jgi:hypothetical protein
MSAKIDVNKVLLAMGMISDGIAAGAAVAGRMFGARESLAALSAACLEMVIKISLANSQLEGDTDERARARFIDTVGDYWDNTKSAHDKKRAEFAEMFGGMN